jgi:hypothetical protein
MMDGAKSGQQERTRFTGVADLQLLLKQLVGRGAQAEVDHRQRLA